YQGAFGAYAEFAAVPAEIAVPLPAEIEAETAAAGLLQGMTAHYLTHDSYRIQPGDWVLVHAGAGGTGGLTVQMAKALGAIVVTTVSTPEKAAVAQENGADHVIDYGQQDFEAEARALDGFAGLAAVYDSIGQATFEQGLRLLRPRGTMVMYGAASGPVEPFDLNRLNPMGSLFVTRPNVKDYVATRAELTARAGAVFDMIQSGDLTVRVGARFPLEEAAAAHRAIETRATTGKVLLLP
ncbi:MAG: zinc-binding dehydrogenase, partial [Minwuiales bacterium]|nr:zinc-binding dehydrogenase [Minwuiales bacterium]